MGDLGIFLTVHYETPVSPISEKQYSTDNLNNLKDRAEFGGSSLKAQGVRTVGNVRWDVNGGILADLSNFNSDHLEKSQRLTSEHPEGLYRVSYIHRKLNAQGGVAFRDFGSRKNNKFKQQNGTLGLSSQHNSNILLKKIKRTVRHRHVLRRFTAARPRCFSARACEEGFLELPYASRRLEPLTHSSSDLACLSTRRNAARRTPFAFRATRTLTPQFESLKSETVFFSPRILTSDVNVT